MFRKFVIDFAVGDVVDVRKKDGCWQKGTVTEIDVHDYLHRLTSMIALRHNNGRPKVKLESGSESLFWDEVKHPQVDFKLDDMVQLKSVSHVLPRSHGKTGRIISDSFDNLDWWKVQLLDGGECLMCRSSWMEKIESRGMQQKD